VIPGNRPIITGFYICKKKKKEKKRKKKVKEKEKKRDVENALASLVYERDSTAMAQLIS